MSSAAVVLNHEETYHENLGVSKGIFKDVLAEDVIPHSESRPEVVSVEPISEEVAWWASEGDTKFRARAIVLNMERFESIETTREFENFVNDLIDDLKALKR